MSHYSNATAVSGGATALPSMIPGLGTLVTLTGGTLVDVALMLKFEVEMALALCRAFDRPLRGFSHGDWLDRL